MCSFSLAAKLTAVSYVVSTESELHSVFLATHHTDPARSPCASDRDLAIALHCLRLSQARVTNCHLTQVIRNANIFSSLKQVVKGKSVINGLFKESPPPPQSPTWAQSWVCNA